MGSNEDVAIRRTPPGNHISAVVAEILHPNVEAGLLKLVKDVLRCFGCPGLSRAASGEIRACEKRHMLSKLVDPNRGYRQEGNDETSGQRIQPSRSHHWRFEF